MDQEVRLRAATYGIPPIVHMVQGDNGRSLKMILEDFEVEDYYDCVVAIHRPDDSYYEIEGMAIPAGNYVSAPAYQAITRPGKVECQLKVSMPGMLISTFDFVIMVHESVVGLPVEQLGYDIYDLIEAAETITPSPGLTDDIKQALLTCFEHVAWTDEHGQDYVDALEAALYPPAELASISAVYTQSGTVYTTDTLDSLKTDLVVTATYSDSTTETLESTDYTLSGTLTEGTSTITVTYEGKTTTFSVTVTAPATLSSITAVYTQSGTVYDTDSLDSLKSDLVVTAVYSDSTTQIVASTDYTLSGTLTEGTSTITVSYGGKTATFNVNVTHSTKVVITSEMDYGVAVNSNTGEIKTQGGWSTTSDYITIPQNCHVLSTRRNTSVYSAVAFYDSNKTYISGGSQSGSTEGSGGTYYIPTSAVYVHISFESLGSTPAILEFYSNLSSDMDWSDTPNGSVNTDGSIKTSGGDAYVASGESIIDGTTIFACGNIGSTFTWVRVAFYNASDEFISQQTNNNGTYNAYDIPSGAKTFAIQAYPGNSATNNDPANQVLVIML